MLKQMLTDHKRKRWIKHQRCRYKNSDVTIVANNCVGGVMYHDLGLKFLTPTVNLFFKADEYLEFAKNFQYYMQCELQEKADNTRNYPVGVIVPLDDAHIPIHLFFQHYTSFKEAANKWNERKRRINYQKICFIWEFYDTLYDLRLAEEFDKLPVKKLLITHRYIEGLSSQCVVNCYDNDKPIAKILEVNKKTGRRYLDEIDWVSFLNTV